MMLIFPGLHDTRRMALAVQRYHEAPSDATRAELEDAKRLDRGEILIWEAALGVVLIWPVVALVRLAEKQS